MAIIACVAALILITQAQSTAACESNTFLCSDCTTLVACFGGTELTLPCTSGQLCGNSGADAMVDACFESGDTNNKNETQCGCDEAATDPSYMADPYNPAAYLACLPEKKAPLSLKCPEGEVFIEGQNPPCGTTTTLPTEATPAPFACPAGGFFTDTADCSKYWACTSESDTNPTGLDCAEATQVFDEATAKCVDPCAATDVCGGTENPMTGGVADSAQCSVFHICVNGAAVGQPLSCPCGQVFNSEKTACEAGTCEKKKCICETASTVASNCAETTTSASSSSSSSSSPSETSSSSVGDSTPTSPGSSPMSDSTPTSPGSSPMSDSTPTSTSSSPMSDSTPTSTSSSSVSDTATTGTGTTPTSDSTTTASSSSPMSDSSSSQSTTSANPSDTTTGSVSTTVGIPDCASASEEGYFANPDGCETFYSCESDNAGGYVLKEYTCPGKLVFDPINQYCNLANLVPGC